MMKKITLLVAFISMLSVKAQTVDEIVNTYFENIGGKENFAKLNGVKFSAKMNQQGMEIPVESYQLKGGKTMTVISFQGKEIKQGVYDGETLWSHNFMTMKAEKATQEATDNKKLEDGDFPDPFLNYKDKGYKIELVGKEEIDGAETFKLKLTKKPITIEGKKVDNISYYYFDTDNYVPILVEKEITSGPMKGKIYQIKMSDYQETEGLYFPFSTSMGLKGGASQALNVTKVELNPQVKEADFKFPTEEK